MATIMKVTISSPKNDFSEGCPYCKHYLKGTCPKKCRELCYGHIKHEIIGKE